MTTGIVLLAYGKPGYAYAAYNMAMSIKYHGCKLPIYLFASRGTFDGVPLNFFDEIKWIDESFYMDGRTLNVARSKIEILNHLPFDQNIYLDVDGMALKDLTPFINEIIFSDKPYMTDVMGSGNYGEDILYDAWAKHEVAWPFFDLDKEDKWRTIQSSWAYFRKCEFISSIYGLLHHYLEKRYPISELKMRWAKGQLPDELLFSGVCAKLDYDPSFKTTPVFFGNHLQKTTTEVINDHYILSMYGNGGSGGTTTKLHWQEFYSSELWNISQKMGGLWYKREYVMRDKILNT
ncbi:MAG: hypothetical protein ACRCST_13065 [Turicibacter sp.]